MQDFGIGVYGFSDFRLKGQAQGHKGLWFGA